MPAPQGLVPPPARSQEALDPPPTTIKKIWTEHLEDGDSDRSRAGLGDAIFIEVGPGDADKLARWAALKGRELSLFIEGQPIRGATVHPVSASDKDTFRVELSRTHENRVVWGSLLGGRLFQGRKVFVRIGLDDGVPLSGAGSFVLAPLPGRSALVIFFVSLAVIAAFVFAATRTPMLRDGLTDQGEPGSFSLSRSQAALWTAQISLAFLWIWAITGQADSVTESCVMLLGLGSATAVGGSIVDKNAAGASSPPSEGLFRDLLKEGDSYALHRFQMILWTLLVSGVFWSSVYRRLMMPELDATLLGLMGISSAGYLTLKSQAADQGAQAARKENKTAPEPEASGEKGAEK